MISRPSTAIDRQGCPADKHGTPWCRYQLGCTCPDAKAAAIRYNKHHRAGLLPPGLVPAIGTARRLQALAVMGYGPADLSRICGHSRKFLVDWRTMRYSMVTQRNATAIARVFEMLVGNEPGPGPSNRARRHARRMGWASPLQWHGVNIDDPAAQPLQCEPDAPRRGPKGVDVDEARHLLAGGMTLDVVAPKVGAVDADALIDALKRDERRKRSAA